MRIDIGTVFCCGLFTIVAWSQSGVEAGSEPSPMEAFASLPGVHTIWSNEIAHMEDGGTHLILMALVLEDNGQPARKVRGVKVSLSSGNDHDLIYLDEEATARTRSALEDIAHAGPPRRNGCMGAKEFWPLYDWPWNKYHELNADFCEDSKGAALVLYGRGKRGSSFRFPGENPSGLAAFLVAAMNQLKEH
jgi:hypothetical protein